MYIENGISFNFLIKHDVDKIQRLTSVAIEKNFTFHS